MHDGTLPGAAGPYGMSPAPCRGTVADEPPEQHPAQVRLVARSAGRRDLAHRVLRCQHQPLRQPYPLEEDIGHWRLAKLCLKGPGEVTRAEIDKRRKVHNPDRRIQVHLDVRQETGICQAASTP